MRRSLVFSASRLRRSSRVAVPAFAQDRTGTVEISPFGGAYFGGDLYDGSLGRDLYVGHRTRRTASDSPTTSPGTSRSSSTGRRPAPTSAPRTSSVLLLHRTSTSAAFARTSTRRTCIFNFGKGRVYGYFGLGAGASVLKTELNAGPSDSQTRFTGNFSAGMKAFFTPHFGFRLDGRLRSTDTDQTTSHGTTLRLLRVLLPLPQHLVLLVGADGRPDLRLLSADLRPARPSSIGATPPASSAIGDAPGAPFRQRRTRPLHREDRIPRSSRPRSSIDAPAKTR